MKLCILMLVSCVWLSAADDNKSTCLNETEKAKIQWLEQKIANLEQRLGAMAAMYDTTVKGFQLEANKPKEPISVPVTNTPVKENDKEVAKVK